MTVAELIYLLDHRFPKDCRVVWYDSEAEVYRPLLDSPELVEPIQDQYGEYPQYAPADIRPLWDSDNLTETVVCLY